MLAPIVAHAADAALLPGLLDALGDLSARTPVGIVSGRNVENLARFGFPEALLVAGSHGAERRGRPLAPLSDAETERLARLRVLADRAARDAGAGAWVETKPTAVVVHVREADPATAEPALATLATAAAAVPGAHVKRGHRIVELAVRAASKAAAIADMRSEVGAAAVSFVGDDITDEDVFAALGAGDLGVRVGAGQTSARRRLRHPGDVLTFVRQLTTDALTDPSVCCDRSVCRADTPAPKHSDGYGLGMTQDEWSPTASPSRGLGGRAVGRRHRGQGRTVRTRARSSPSWAATAVGVKAGANRDEADEWLARYPDDASVMAYIGRSGWNTLRIGGAIPDDEIEEAIDTSYELVVAKLPQVAAPDVATGPTRQVCSLVTEEIRDTLRTRWLWSVVPRRQRTARSPRDRPRGDDDRRDRRTLPGGQLLPELPPDARRAARRALPASHGASVAGAAPLRHRLSAASRRGRSTHE